MYTKDSCVSCNSAKQLLGERKIPFTEYKIGVDLTREQVLDLFPDATSVPIVIIDGKPIGGYVDLKSLLTSEKESM